MTVFKSSTALEAGALWVAPKGKPSVHQREYTWAIFVFAFVMAILATSSGFATFNGLRIFLDEIGGSSLMTKGTSIIITISIVTMLTAGWAWILRLAPEAPTAGLRVRMVCLGLVLTLITLCASTTSNLMAFSGPPSKVYDWTQTHIEHVRLANALETSVRGIEKIMPAWEAQKTEACQLAALELGGGVASGTGAGNGPVAASFTRVCAQTSSFLQSMGAARAAAIDGVARAHEALRTMQAAIRDRGSDIVDREDRFLAAGAALNGALQDVRAADLTDVMDAGAAQVKASVTELSETTAFSPRQAEAVKAISGGLSGLLASTDLITERLKRDPIPAQHIIASPDYISAIARHGWRFLPTGAAALAIDLFPLWALMLLMTARLSALRRDELDCARIPPAP